MSINPVTSRPAWTTPSAWTGPAAVTGGDFAAALVTPHRFLPNDPANQYLTDGDRAAIRTATGVDVRADGGIGCPVSMDLQTYCTVLDGVGQIAADRANGRLTGPITQTYLHTVLAAAVGAGPGPDGRDVDNRLDVNA